jgi:hypothetical protein
MDMILQGDRHGESPSLATLDRAKPESGSLAKIMFPGVGYHSLAEDHVKIR